MSLPPDEAAPEDSRRVKDRGSRGALAGAAPRSAPLVVGPAAPPEVVTADAVAAAVLACPLVVALSGGRVGEVATYLPGRRVTGVRIGDDAVTVHVVAAYGPTCEQVAAQVRQAVQTLVGGRPVTVGIDDLDLDRRIIIL